MNAQILTETHFSKVKQLNAILEMINKNRAFMNSFMADSQKDVYQLSGLSDWNLQQVAKRVYIEERLQAYYAKKVFALSSTTYNEINSIQLNKQLKVA